MSSNEDSKWLEFYKKVLKRWLNFVDKAWETIKFHTLLLSSLVSITASALALMHTSDVFLKLGIVERVVLTGALLIFPITMLLILRIGLDNFNRTCRRMYERASVVMKLEEKFRLLGERTEKKQFPLDETYVPKKYVEKIWASSDDYIKDMMLEKDAFYSNMSRIFKLFWWLSWTLAAVIFVLILLHLIGYFQLPVS